MSSSTRVLRNDGLGSAVTLKLRPLSIQIDGSAWDGVTGIPLLDDTLPPEPFTPIISRSDDIFNGDYFIVFSTTDRESGLSSYEIAEARRGVRPLNLSWRSATSPERLQDQSLMSTVYIKAIDQNGNERIVTVGPLHRSYLLPVFFMLLMMAALVFYYRDRLYPLFESAARNSNKP